MVRSPRVLAVGGAHIDRRGQVSGAYVPAASNPGTMREDVGGGVFNALRSTVRRGVSGSLLSVRGGDAAADTVSRAIAEAGIADLSAVFLDRTTPSYTALIDREGELLVGFADMALYELAFAKQIRRSRVREEIAAADAVLCDANLPSAALERLVSLAAGKPVFAIAISPAKVVRLTPVLGGLAVAFMNRREAVALAGLDDAASQKTILDGLRSAGLDSAVVTAGGGPVLGFDRDGSFAVVPPPPRKVVDVTGAGDALAGATVAALLRGMPLRAALREGVAAATLAIESASAVPDFTTATFAQALALVPEEQKMA
ncbi:MULTISPECIES: carbohydrate kinase family protein [unclassified Mesorhizobium]|uniref:carbohydrate kinase family protein n=1 Tax=unclassified Mesorhizobium TaxID=325217 RepID=UPI0011286445|nr:MULTISPECIES: carbohydrate kinase family protein [unclassified Mesorhizobium]TPJ45845.1 carbohydrate kinase [Mesorhizobium sp. B2-6-6]MBZ9703692.1 carbohydrate kinase family protein [Mesorhizobium sp. CO1-1-3]MBZ9917597.1 carbohydrate kinase family protein [Mesorhizobium sp. BR1-1-7]MBZ9950504.1 carbohydrate kinase family protein [Mesorhizobium sp. BR1-1-11]MBZ9956040.1 carbohydrate kinase family protein [Mesorhizobium sp. BR1-1-15]